MRMILVMLVLLAGSWAAALAADGDGVANSDRAMTGGYGTILGSVTSSGARMDTAVDNCCRAFTATCLEVKFSPRCDRLAHHCAVPYSPCERCLCLTPPCHRPVVPCGPCLQKVCVSASCHQPVTPLGLCDPCPVEPWLSGSRELITASCECEAECSCDEAADA